MLPSGREQQAERAVGIHPPEALRRLGLLLCSRGAAKHRVYVGIAVCATSHKDVGVARLAGG